MHRPRYPGVRRVFRQPRGGDGEGPYRDYFKDTVTFLTIKTGSNGKTSASFKLPDNITSWRITTIGITDNYKAGVNKTNLVKNAIATVFNGSNLGLTIGGIFVAVCLFFFAFSTILSWNLFGKINFTYLFGKKSVIVYTIIAIVFVFLGSIFQNDLVWELTDFFNYLMVLPNVMAMFVLSKIVVTELKTNGKKSAVDTPNEPLNTEIK